MIQISAWQVDFHWGRLDLGLLIQTDKLKGILKLYTVATSYHQHPTITQENHFIFETSKVSVLEGKFPV